MYTRLVLALLLTGSFLAASGKRTVRQDVNYCTDDDARNSLYASTYPECARNLAAFERPFEDTLRDLFCNATCGPLYASFFLERCTDLVYQQLVQYYQLQCVVNEDGRPCYSFYNNSDIDMSVANPEAVTLCSSSATGACSDACAVRLEAIKDYYGTCINSVFNSTYFRFSGNDLPPLFQYRLWSNCGVSPPTSTSVNPTTDNTPTDSGTAGATPTLAIKLFGAVCVLLAISLY